MWTSCLCVSRFDFSLNIIMHSSHLLILLFELLWSFSMWISTWTLFLKLSLHKTQVTFSRLYFLHMTLGHEIWPFVWISLSTRIAEQPDNIIYCFVKTWLLSWLVWISCSTRYWQNNWPFDRMFHEHMAFKLIIVWIYLSTRMLHETVAIKLTFVRVSLSTRITEQLIIC